MIIKMFPCVLFFCTLMLLTVDTRIGASPHTNIEPRQCHQCDSTNCEQLSSAKCPVDQPYCATIATAPNFTSYLSCRPAQESPCVLEYKTEYMFSCICDNNLCNAPYNQRLRNELFNFSTNIQANNVANLTEIFLKFSEFANVTNEAIYEMVTANTTSTAIAPVTSTSAEILFKNLTHFNVSEDLIPRPQALKHASTVPPDDDEDESEGSGTSTDESKFHEHASPASPSSYLPAKENNAQSLSLKIVFFLTPLSFYRFLLVNN